MLTHSHKRHGIRLPDCLPTRLWRFELDIGAKHGHPDTHYAWGYYNCQRECSRRVRQSPGLRHRPDRGPSAALEDSDGLATPELRRHARSCPLSVWRQDARTPLVLHPQGQSDTLRCREQEHPLEEHARHWLVRAITAHVGQVGRALIFLSSGGISLPGGERYCYEKLKKEKKGGFVLWTLFLSTSLLVLFFFS